MADGVDWYRHNDRLRTAPTRDNALDAAVAAWDADRRDGHATILLAWRRRDVAALNQRAHQRRVEAGEITGPEIEAAGGKRYAAGDQVVTLAPSGDGRTALLAGEELLRDRLDHAYAVTVHRLQGATVDRAHVFADGGGRELAYVAMSRARDTSHVYVVADDLDQAVEELTVEWSSDRRQRWVLDVDEPAIDERPRRPRLAWRTENALRLARLRNERDAVQAVAPQAVDRLRSLDVQLRLEQVAQRPARRPEIGLWR